MTRTIFFVSHGTGITAETLGRTLLTQFDGLQCQELIWPFVDTMEKAQGVVEAINRMAESDGVRPIVFATLTDPTLLELLEGSNAFVMDLFSAFLGPLESELGLRSIHAKGRSHGMANDAAYAMRMDALNFALSHDDGGNPDQYRQAEVILMGVSRTGKTPTSIYLAMQFGLHSANYPLTEEDLARPYLPKVLQPFRERIYGLTIDPMRLHQIRTERRPESDYASTARCRREVGDAEAIFRTEGIRFLDVTSVSIEEIAAQLLQEMGLKRRLF